MANKAKTNVLTTEVITEENDLFGFLGNADSLPDDSDLWGGSYPMIQWHNPSKAWEFPMKHWAGTAIEVNYPPVEVDHGESTEFSSLVDTIHLSIIAWRVTWEKQDEATGKMTYAAQPVEGERWSKRYNFLALVKELESDEPAIITIRGYTGQYFQGGYEQARKRTLKLARQATRRSFPGYVFWTPMAAGGKVMVGSEKKSAIYPPAPVIEEIAEMDDVSVATLLKSLYIGDRLRDTIGSYLFDEGQKWSSEFQALPAGNNVPQLTGPAISILPGNQLYFTDLSDKSPADWIKAAMELPGLFQAENHASNAFAKLLRSKGLGGDSRANQWEAWRADLEKRWEALQTEKMLQAS